MSKPLVLVTGCLGQLGHAIQQHWYASQVAASYELLPVDIDQLDLTDTDDLLAYLDQLQPTIIINTAAFTHVDEAETNRDAAYAVNAEAVLTLVKWCRVSGCKLIQISTDFVFDGAATAPYSTDAQTNPLSNMGRVSSLAKTMFWIFCHVPATWFARHGCTPNMAVTLKRPCESYETEVGDKGGE